MQPYVDYLMHFILGQLSLLGLNLLLSYNVGTTIVIRTPVVDLDYHLLVLSTHLGQPRRMPCMRLRPIVQVINRRQVPPLPVVWISLHLTVMI
jgi:hypothetical protein